MKVKEEKIAIVKVQRVTKRIVDKVVLSGTTLLILLHLPLHICSNPPKPTPQPSPALHSHHPRFKFKTTAHQNHLHFSTQKERKRDEKKLTLLGIIYAERLLFCVCLCWVYLCRLNGWLGGEV